MAYTQSDLTTIQNAIISLAAGERAVEVTLSSGKKIRYAEADLAQLRILEKEVAAGLQTTRQPRILVSSRKGF